MLTEDPPPLARMEECPSSQLQYRLYQPWAKLSLQSGICNMELGGLATKRIQNHLVLRLPRTICTNP